MGNSFGAKERSSLRGVALRLFLCSGFNSESSIDTLETVRLLYCRTSQLGHRGVQAKKADLLVMEKFILLPKAYENVLKVSRAVK